MKKKKSMVLTIVAVATLIALLVGATYAYFQATGGQAANADVKVTTYTTDLLTFTTGVSIAIYADQSNFASGLGNQSGTTFARAHLLANNKTNTATDNYYVYLDITNNNFEYTQEDSTTELLLQVTDPNGVEVTTLSGLEYKTITDGKGNEVKGFDVTTLEGLVTIANNYEIVANPEITQTWNASIVFVNLDADQIKNTGKTLSASLTITKEAQTTTLADWVKSQYTTQGVNNLYFHDSSLANGAEDNSYRYAGPSDTTNNFVCFGSDATPCPDDNLYRFIGVFGDQVKLIKWDYATTALLGTDGNYSKSYATEVTSLGIAAGTSKGTNVQTTIGAYWWYNDGIESETNTWSVSKLNIVNLNTNYLNNIGSTWVNKIADTTWKVGGNTLDNIQSKTAANAYKNEYTNPVENTTYSAKIGLMYVSDYGYAASPSAWTSTLDNYNYYTNENWMYMGLYERTMTRFSNGIGGACHIGQEGGVGANTTGTRSFGIRPVFYLESSVNYVSGDGSKNNPIIIN